MEPVAKRTRRQAEEKLLKDYRERKKSAPVNNPLAASASRTVVIIDDDDEEEEEVESTNSASDRVVVEEEIPDFADSPPILTLSSSTESDESDTAEEESSESEDSEEEWNSKLKSRSVTSRSGKTPVPEKEQKRLILLDDDDDDEIQAIDRSAGVNDAQIPPIEHIDDESDGDFSGIDDDAQISPTTVNRGKKPLTDDDEIDPQSPLKKHIDDEIDGDFAEQIDNEDEDEERVAKKRVNKRKPLTDDDEIDAQSPLKKHTDDEIDGDFAEQIDDEDEDEERVAKKRVYKRKPLTDDEIHRVLFNSIMDVDSGVAKPHTNSTSSSDLDSDMEMEEPKEEDELDSMYNLMDFCLACIDTDSADASPDEDDDNPKDQSQLCNQGQHHLILDEEIGIVCKFCGLIREEIKHVLPPFHDNPFGESDKRRYSSYDHRGNLDLPSLEDPSYEYQKPEEEVNFDPSGTVWEIQPGLRGALMKHQREAFEFIWRNVGGSTKIDELGGNGGGCLISHAPGTGKTRLAIAFLETYMRMNKNSRPVIVAPASILLTWKKEFDKWKIGVPFQNLSDEDLSKEEAAMASSLGIASIKRLEPTAKRLIKLLYWKRHESVMVVSYTLFTQLAGGEGVKKRGRVKIHNRPSIDKSREESQLFRTMLLDLPGLLILDECHVPRNDRTGGYKVLSEVKTRRRVGLSGTPFQNNFRELYNIFCLVRPEFAKFWEKNPFKSTVDEADGGKIRELKAKTEPYFHRYDGSIVDATVPGLNDNVVFLEPSESQKELLEKVEDVRNHLEANVCTALISVHPRLLDYRDRNPDFAEELKCGKWDLSEGAKTRFLIRLIELSSAFKERVLVFSEYIQPLNFIKAVLESTEYFGWKEGREILFMSGSHDMKSRKRSMDLLNKTSSEAKVMLASIKACSEGIELTGASRVVLLDVTWNPAVERQAMCRAYRIGQGRVVHVYHLIMTDHDSNRHITQTQKNECSKYVFSSRGGASDAHGSSKPASEDHILEQLLEENIVKETKPASETPLVARR